MVIDYLRISVTEECNLKCFYCTPAAPGKGRRRRILSRQEILNLATTFAKLGIKYIRLTGGEPLMRDDIAEIVEGLKEIKGIEEVSLTTNGTLFAKYADRLRNSGLDRINISLDTLRRNRFMHLTGGDGLEAAWQAVKKAIELKLLPVKINTIPLMGLNDDEILDFAELTLNHSISVRFIEYMSGRNMGAKPIFIPSNEILEKIKERYPAFAGDRPPKGRGPARYIKIKGAQGHIGFISPNTSPFCTDCNRLRLSCDGRLFPCLASTNYINLRGLINTSDIKKIMLDKARSNNSPIKPTRGLDMIYIGG